MPWLAIALAFSAGACAPRTTVRQHPEFETRRRQIASVGIVPTTAIFKLLTFKGDNQPLVEDEKSAREALSQLLAGSLKSRGFAVVETGSPDSGGSESMDLRFQLNQANQSFATAAHEAYVPYLLAPVGTATNYRRSLGPMVSAIADRASVDALLFSEIQGFRKSGGEIAKDVAKSVLTTVVSLGLVRRLQPTEGAILFVALVDGTT